MITTAQSPQVNYGSLAAVAQRAFDGILLKINLMENYSSSYLMDIPNYPKYILRIYWSEYGATGIGKWDYKIIKKLVHSDPCFDEDAIPLVKFQDVHTQASWYWEYHLLPTLKEQSKEESFISDLPEYPHLALYSFCDKDLDSVYDMSLLGWRFRIVPKLILSWTRKEIMAVILGFFGQNAGGDRHKVTKKTRDSLFKYCVKACERLRKYTIVECFSRTAYDVAIAVLLERGEIFESSAGVLTCPKKEVERRVTPTLPRTPQKRTFLSLK